MKKFKLYFDKDEEVKWLNEMTEQGWECTDFKGGFYSFKPCLPGEWLYEADLNDHGFILSKEYRELLKDNKINVICTWGFWFLAKRKAQYGPFQLYTDLESKILQYKKIRNMFLGAGLLELICFYAEMFAFQEMKQWYFFVFSALLLGLFYVLWKAGLNMKNKIAALEGKEVTDPSSIHCLMGEVLVTCIAMLLRNYIPHLLYLFILVACIVVEIGLTIKIKKENE